MVFPVLFFHSHIRIYYLFIILILYHIFNTASAIRVTSPPRPYLSYPSLIFHFNLLPTPVDPTGFSFYIIQGFLAIFIWSSKNKNVLSPHLF